MKKINAFVARDKDNSLYLYYNKPQKIFDCWVLAVDSLNNGYLKIDESDLPDGVNPSWDDTEPIMVELAIYKKSVQPHNQYLLQYEKEKADFEKYVDGNVQPYPNFTSWFEEKKNKQSICEKCKHCDTTGFCSEMRMVTWGIKSCSSFDSK